MNLRNLEKPHLAAGLSTLRQSGFDQKRIRRLRNRRSRLLLVAWAIVLGLFVDLAQAQLDPRESFRQRMLRLLAEIHSVDENESEQALAELQKLGVTEEQLNFAKRLKHPDRFERMRLVQMLSKAPASLAKELKLELLQDRDVSIRVATFNQLKPSDIDQDLVDLLERRSAVEQDHSLKQRVGLALADIKKRYTEKSHLSQSSNANQIHVANHTVLNRSPNNDGGPLNSQAKALHSATPRTMNFDAARGLNQHVIRSGPPLTVPQQGQLQEKPTQRFAQEPRRLNPVRPIVDGEVVAADYYETVGSPRPTVELVNREKPKLLPPAPGAANPIVGIDLPDPNRPNADVEQLFQPGAPIPNFPAMPAEAQPMPRRRPGILDRPLSQPMVTRLPQYADDGPILTPEAEAPYGFSGPSGILPTEEQISSHFVPQFDRWRNGYTPWDRYKKRHPWVDDYPGIEGHWWDPYNQNVIKGDYPIIGQHTFFNLTATSQTAFDFRQVPTPTTPFESTRGFDQREFFGQPEEHAIVQNLYLRMDLFHGAQSGFKPLDWQFRVTPAVNMNYTHFQELALVNPDTRYGRTRFRDHFVLQEYFAEAKIADISPDYDFASVRAGNQFFNSDFRGFVFFDTNRAIRLFGSRLSNRHQFNLLFYDMVEKETNSQLNTLRDRHQNVLIANYYIQDFIFPGYTFQTSFHWNHDQPSMRFDRNDFLVRPDPTGVFQPHRVESYYFGFAGDGHMGRINVNNAFYWVTGRDSLNPIGGQAIDINAYMAAIELSYDRDWARFRTSLFWASGDDNPNDNDGNGFDEIMGNPLFGGGEFTYWQRQAVQLFGVRLVNDRSLVPNLRSSRIQGQSNFTNPGLFLFNVGFDADITPKLRLVSNANYLMFDETEVLKAFTFQGDVDKEIGLDLSVGFEYRPFHNDNMIMVFGLSSLIPDEGFKDLYNQYNSGDTEALFAGFFEMILTY